MMPIGWGDTYFQSVAGQSFDVTHLPNGTYYIEVLANPERVLRETSTSNDVSLRKVILGGTRGHRTVRVPAFDGIDPEHRPGGRDASRIPAGPAPTRRRLTAQGRFRNEGRPAPVPCAAWMPGTGCQG